MLLPYCRQFQSQYKHVALYSYCTADSSSPCKYMKLCAFTVLKTDPVPVDICKFCCYRIAESSIPCTNMQRFAVTVFQTVPIPAKGKQLCAVTVLHTVIVPVQTCNVALLNYCREFHSLQNIQLCAVTVFQRVPFPVQTLNILLLQYCRKFQSLYKHANLCSCRIAESSSPCKIMQLFAVTVMQTVQFHVETCSVVPLLYCRQFQSLHSHATLCSYLIADSSIPSTNM